MSQCMFCPATKNLTQEHVFAAALGGKDVVNSATCKTCNALFGREFESEFNNGLKPLCYLLRIGNRQRIVPKMEATATIDDKRFKVVLEPDRGFRIENRVVERLDEHGRTVKDYFLFSKQSKKRLEQRAEKRGEVLQTIPTRPIEIEPESFMPLNFIASSGALRSATKVALLALAYKAGIPLTRSSTFDRAKRFIVTGEGKVAWLFVNKTFAARHAIGPHQHSVEICSDCREHSVYAIVTFFGGLTYLVQLSESYSGVEFGFTYGYDALARTEVPVFVQQLDNERRAIADVRFGDSRFDDLMAMVEHWATVIQRVASERLEPVQGVPPSLTRHNAD